MPAFAPRISSRLLVEIERSDDPSVPIAEVCRRVGATAERLGLPRPSYERVRVLVHEGRRRRPVVTTASVVVDVALRTGPVDALLDRWLRRRRAASRPVTPGPNGQVTQCYLERPSWWVGIGVAVGWGRRKPDAGPRSP